MLKARDEVLHFEHFTIESALRGGKRLLMINGAQRLDSAPGFRNQAFGRSALGGFKKPCQKRRADHRHIARNQNIPFRFCISESGEQSTQRPAFFHLVGPDRIFQMTVAFQGTENRRAARGLLNDAGNVLDQSAFAEPEQGFIAAHPDAFTARRHESRSTHEKMITTLIDSFRMTRRIVESNKIVYICFLLAIAMLAASPSRAAETSTSVPAPARQTQVVRADPKTGKLVRSVVVSSKPVLPKIAPKPAPVNGDVNTMVEQSARAHNVDPLLVHSIIKVESNYDVHAVSKKGAQGLMQLTPSTARMLGVSNSFDPQQNIEAGVKYLKYLQDVYKDDRLALAAYNAGPGAVDKYKWIPPYAETQNYVYQVGKKYGEARRAAGTDQKAADAKPVEVKAAAPEAEKHPKLEQFVDENGRLHLKTALP